MALTAAVIAGVVGAAAPAMAADHPDILIAAHELRGFIDPGRDISNRGAMTSSNTFDGLVVRDVYDTEVSLAPSLATEWEQVDPTTWRFTLREGVTFHNGDALTAEDVVFSFDRFLEGWHPQFINIREAFFSNLKDVTALSATEVEIVTHRDDPILPVRLATEQAFIVPRDYIMGLSPGGTDAPPTPEAFDAFGRKPVGSGPYRVTAFEPETRLVWERNEDYWSVKPPVQRIEIVEVPEVASRIRGLEQGQFNFITNIPPDHALPFDGREGFRRIGVLNNLFFIMFVKSEQPATDDARIRRAIHYAIDRQAIVDALWAGLAEVPTHHGFAVYGDQYDADHVTVDFDPSKARALIAEAGYDGEEIVLWTRHEGYADRVAVAEIVQQMLAAVGLNVKLMLEQSWSQRDPNVDMGMWTNPMYFPDPTGSLGIMWGPNGFGVNRGLWKPDIADFENRWNDAIYQADRSKRREMIYGLLKEIEQERPYILLYRPHESYITADEIRWKPPVSNRPYVLNFHADAFAP